MKLTDFALIFIGVTLPIIIIVYVNVSYTIKAQEQEMYYKKILDRAIQDATYQMKEVENDDKSIDYGYSGLENKKISVNAQIAKDTFFTTLYNNFNIKGNKDAEKYLQTFIPCLAIIDYNGVYISSMEKYKNSDGEDIEEHIVKPKKNYTYTYSIKKGSFYEGIVDDFDEMHVIEFSMDDYIIHRGFKLNEKMDTKGFYLNDFKYNSVLCYYDKKDVDFKNIDISDIEYDNENKNVSIISSFLNKIKKSVITTTIVNEISYATNRSNSFAKNIGINYEFSFPNITNEDINNITENIGMFGFIQGLNLGNKYLNAKSYSISRLENSTKYYFSFSDNGINYYHKSKECQQKHVKNIEKFTITPSYVLSKQQAASAQIVVTDTTNNNQKFYEGFYPCPECNP